MARQDDKLFAADHPPATNGFLARLADFAYRRSRLVVGIWLATMIIVLGIGSAINGKFRADY